MGTLIIAMIVIILFIVFIWFLFTLSDIKRAVTGTEEKLTELIELIKQGNKE